MDPVLIFQLAILAATGVLSVLAALSARRAASFDVTRDFDALAHAVAKLQQAARSTQMSRVRQAALQPAAEPATAPSLTHPMSHSQLRELARRRNGVQP